MNKLPINLRDLLRQRTAEGERVEYTAGWNPDTILRTLCAFPDDFENLGGGYGVIGQDCDTNGQPIFPAHRLGHEPARQDSAGAAEPDGAGAVG